MTALSEVLREANGGKLSARSIAREAQAAGFSLNHDTVARYLRGDHGRPDEPTLRAFAAVLKVPLARLREAADLPSEAIEPYVPPAEASRLTRRQRKAVDEIIRAMLDSPTQATVTPMSRRPARRRAAADGDATDPAAQAARRGGTERKN